MATTTTAAAGRATGDRPVRRPRPELWGRDLRYVLTDHLFEIGRSQTVDQLVEAVHRTGYAVRGRPSKAVSDALRADLDHGRVVRLARGTYAAGRMPRQTRAWRADRVRALVTWIEADDAA